MKCPNCGHHFTQERKTKGTYQERPGKLKRYMSDYESWRRSWLADQGRRFDFVGSPTKTPSWITRYHDWRAGKPSDYIPHPHPLTE